ncbi:hypothetical protein GCM10009114_18020 [Aliiglaciecola litoralis]|uniref:EAL domain-containing protein n=1 Tax=Aliiglaciecola litoralis TaxID=582857 RepID=A0ABN1LIX7_9ALTE
MNAQNSGDLQTVLVDDSTEQVALLNHMEFVRTPQRMQLSQIQHATNWTIERKNVPLTKKQALWSRFSVDYLGNQPATFAVVINNPSIDYLDAYVLDDKGRILGSFLVGSKRDTVLQSNLHRNFVLPIELLPGQKKQIYMRIRDDGPAAYSVELWRDSARVIQEQYHSMFISLVSGALVMLFCYFLLTYMMLRSPIRFWFAIANFGLLLLFLAIQGTLSQVTGLGAYSSSVISVLIAIIILAAAKVCHAMLANVPMLWRFMSYLLAIGLLAIAPILDSYWQIVISSVLTTIAVLLHLSLAVIYQNRQHNTPNRLYALGWLVISATAMLNVSLYLSGTHSSLEMDVTISGIMMLGLLLIAAAIASHEKSVAFVQQVHQQNLIDNLHHFYDLFRNSAEGLYTSTKQGKLVTTNPAMASLFGYQDETQMLEEVQDTSQLYANPSERELLLKEIYQNGKALGKEIKGLRRDGSEFWFCISVQLTRDTQEDLFFGSIFDITEKKQSNISLEYLATHDSLTGVYNRREFEQKLRDAIRHSKQLKQELILLYMDLDQFKLVNDTCGHKAGDALIKQLSQLLNDEVMGKGLLARLGGDEFGVILEGDNADFAMEIAYRMLKVIEQYRFNWENHIFAMGISIGVAQWNDQVDTPEQLLSMADAACYAAKEQGRNQVHQYSNEDHKTKRYENELEWVSQLTNALEQDRFCLYYQHYYPLSKVADGHHYEILLRMLDEQDNIIPPSVFLSAAERYGLTAQIDKWVIKHTFKWLAANPQHLQQLNTCNINLSGHSLADNDLKREVVQCFDEYRIPHDKICFEITESMAIVKLDETLRFINTFTKLGCTFALDDFGSGFSSYSYLKHLPVDCVKIDGSFIKDMLLDPVDMAMVCSIKDVAKAMSMRTVAEFVESKDIMIELGKIGVDFAQGFGIAKPAPLTDFKPCKTID